MRNISELVKFTFYDASAKEQVHILELDELKNELRQLVKEKGLKDKWVKEFFEI